MIKDEGGTKVERSAGLGPGMVRGADGGDASAQTPGQLARLPDADLTPRQLAKRVKDRAKRERYKAKHPELYPAQKLAERVRAKVRKLTGLAPPPPLSAEERSALKAARRKRFMAKDPQRWREMRAAEKRRATACRRDAAVARSEELLRTHTLDTGDTTHGA